ncbi:phospholipid scramblase 2 isoform X1 [Drosophila mauritiana]|uniref:Phospholipid scramblase n=1 Tax=Drosophila mauritiana TaxID=7226 RepID=A0A6P8JQ69_DROMA|nr:phospholipid scramblase 2 isoform X1 [Drosophila mauritiana]
MKSNVNQGGYAPPGFGSGFQPNAPPAEGFGYPPPSGGHNAPYPSAPGHPQPPPPMNYGFTPGPQQAGYAPVPQMPPYGEAPPYGAGQPPYMGGPGGQPPYAGGPGGQPPYVGAPGGQPPYGGGAPPPHAFGGYPPGPAGPGGPPNAFGGYPPGQPQQPIVTQPGMGPGMGPGMAPQGGPAGDWMSIPTGIPNCPRGLEYLTTIDQLLVKQKVELLEAFTGFETNNKFTIKNALGQKVYFAAEDNDCCTRNCCGPARPFDMRVFDNFQQEVIHMHRPLACSSCLFPCCLQSIEVSAPPGNVIGTIEQEWSICSPSFRILNHVGDTVMRIEGPFCTFSLCGDVEFNVVSLTGEKIGKISKQWSGLAREIFTDADFFGINFPLDLDVRMKAVLLGATFLIDAMFFEKAGNQETDRPGML